MADRDLQVVLNSGEINTINLGGTASTDAVLNKGANDVIYQDLAGENAIVKTKFTPQTMMPTWVKGQQYYNDTKGVHVLDGPYADADINIGRGMQMEVQNNTGVLIPKGTAVRQSGVTAGVVQIVPALADSFDNARLIGITQHDIADGALGVLSTFGEIVDFDTSLLPVGVPLYLSDTVAGTYSATVPDIVTRIGGCLVSDATEGRLFVYIINNKSLPSVFGGLLGQTAGNETYAVTTTAQNIINYDTARSVLTPVTALTGLIEVAFDGDYRMNFTASISFPSTTTTRSVTFEFYDVTNAAIEYSFVKNIPRDATADGVSFSFPFSEAADDVHVMRIKSSTAISVTFDSISFDVESVLIK